MVISSAVGGELRRDESRPPNATELIEKKQDKEDEGSSEEDHLYAPHNCMLCPQYHCEDGFKPTMFRRYVCQNCAHVHQKRGQEAVWTGQDGSDPRNSVSPHGSMQI